MALSDSGGSPGCEEEAAAWPRVLVLQLGQQICGKGHFLVAFWWEGAIVMSLQAEPWLGSSWKGCLWPP